MPPEPSEQGAEILTSLTAACFWTFDIPNARDYAARALRIADSLGRDDLAATPIGWMGACEQSENPTLAVARQTYRRALARDIPVHADVLASFHDRPEAHRHAEQ